MPESNPVPAAQATEINGIGPTSISSDPVPAEFLKSFTPEIVSPHNGNVDADGCDMCKLEDDEIDELLSTAEGRDKAYT